MKAKNSLILIILKVNQVFKNSQIMKKTMQVIIMAALG